MEMPILGRSDICTDYNIMKKQEDVIGIHTAVSEIESATIKKAFERR